jgi:hypothetical protein
VTRRLAALAPMICAVCVVCALGRTAHADRAEQLFRKGKKLLAEKRYAEACGAFQDSDRLDPGIGAKLNVAKCYQEWGKLATAWRWYIDAEQMAKGLKDDRAKKIRALADELDASVPRLMLKAPSDATPASVASVVIVLDGAPFDVATLGTEQRVDPGPHQIEYTVNGTKRDKVVPIERGGSAEVVLELPVKHRKADRPIAADPGADPGRTRRLVGLGVAGGGVVALGVAGVVTLRARSDYHHALSAHCRGSTAMCDATGQAAADSAHHRANLATVVTIGGLVAVTGGIVVYLLAPRAGSRDGEHAMYLAPSVGGDANGVVFGGAF